MATDDDMFDVAICTYCLAVVSYAGLSLEINKSSKNKPKRVHRVWVNKYLAVRPQYGAYNSLMRDLLELDSTKFRNYIRMEPDVFEELFVKVEPFISKKNTILR